MKWRHGFVSLSVFISVAAAAAGGFSMSLSRTQNMEGTEVPEVVIVVDRNASSLNRQSVQAAITRTLGSAGVRPELIELQSVATSAMNMANDKQEGIERICYVSWCSRVYLAGTSR
ncbi:hypothetical protein K3181_13195 [Qipengyuania sp. YG27]|uniref:Uncharacterized protein n=1 Tax=Qipengyuania mesophila TaxID=2867246 RepID=A0ABS7JXL7_9SPHN|nr:hypothetical protein [Qipengyuania mesophila]MBX7502400.1 hypothetical protein [Qipengyuania mesophila]